MIESDLCFEEEFSVAGRLTLVFNKTQKKCRFKKRKRGKLLNIKIITTPTMPAANGHYSHCIEHNGLLYLAGQLPRDPFTKEIPESIEKQTLAALNNVEMILTEAGSSVQNIIQVRLYISDIALWDQVNEVYKEFMGSHKPVRSIIPTRELHFGALIEVEVTAVVVS